MGLVAEGVPKSTRQPRLYVIDCRGVVTVGESSARLADEVGLIEGNFAAIAARAATESWLASGGTRCVQ
jgi:hypothetical protein